jgi:hypothetical protein
MQDSNLGYNSYGILNYWAEDGHQISSQLVSTSSSLSLRLWPATHLHLTSSVLMTITWQSKPLNIVSMKVEPNVPANGRFGAYQWTGGCSYDWKGSLWLLYSHCTIFSAWRRLQGFCVQKLVSWKPEDYVRIGTWCLKYGEKTLFCPALWDGWFFLETKISIGGNFTVTLYDVKDVLSFDDYGC